MRLSAAAALFRVLFRVFQQRSDLLLLLRLLCLGCAAGQKKARVKQLGDAYTDDDWNAAAVMPGARSLTMSGTWRNTGVPEEIVMGKSYEDKSFDDTNINSESVVNDITKCDWPSLNHQESADVKAWPLSKYLKYVR